MTHAKVAPVAALLLVAAIGLTAKDAAAQFPPNRRSRLPSPGHGVPREIPRNMPRSAVTGHFLP